MHLTALGLLLYSLFFGLFCPVALEGSGVDDLDVDVVPFADGGEFGWYARQTHA